MKRFLNEFVCGLLMMCKFLVVISIMVAPIAVVAAIGAWGMLLYFVCIPAAGALFEVWKL